MTLRRDEDQHHQQSTRGYNPSFNSSLAFVASQPLLQNRGSYVNKLSLMTARSRLRMSEYNLRFQC